jgi:hypothetical protein
MRDATELLCAKAKDAGAAVLALRNTHHIGRVGAWAEQAAAHGLASFFVVDVAGVDAKVAPTGGIAGRLGTNPICLGLPVKGHAPIVADMATSQIAVGKVRVAFNKGVRLPPGILIDHEGKPTTDPATMYTHPAGALLTMAAHKGYALSALIELFAGALGGGGTIATWQPEETRILNNAIGVAIDRRGHWGTAYRLDSQPVAASADGRLDLAGAIALAIESQNASTQEISRNVSQTIAAVRDVSTKIGGISRAADAVGEGVADIRATIQTASRCVADLRENLTTVVRSAAEDADRRISA